MVVVSLDMFLNNTQDIFVKHKNDKFCLVKGNKNSGKTISTIFKSLYLKRNYCFELDDKILFLTNESEFKNIVDIFNYINRSDLYKSIIPSDSVEVHVLTYERLISMNSENTYTHVIIDNVEEMSRSQIENVLSIFKNVSYSKVYFIQNSINDNENVSSLVEYAGYIIGSRAVIFKFRYVIDNSDRDEFTQIGMAPEIKYLDYDYKEYVDFDTKKVEGYYTSCGNLYTDKGTFLHNLTSESVDICLLDRYLNVKGSIRILKKWIKDEKDLCCVEINDEGMGKYDLFRGDIVLIDKYSDIKNNDIVVIFKDYRIYARKLVMFKDEIKFISGESIFKDIHMDSNVKILGKVISYIRS